MINLLDSIAHANLNNRILLFLGTLDSIAHANINNRKLLFLGTTLKLMRNFINICTITNFS